MSNPTLTVIVPCHNVEAYLPRCVASITGQSYKALDILLIDDGSTDGTTAICNKLRDSDNRIRVIHQLNAGLSLTREIGIKNTENDSATFVDADDRLHPDIYSHMMGALLKENADIVQCGVCDTFDDGREKHRYQDFIDNSYTKYGHKEGFFKLIEEKEWRSYFWNKIYRTKLFHDVTFPAGRGLYENRQQIALKDKTA